MSLKNSETNRSRTRYLPACNAVPQPSAPLRTPNLLQYIIRYYRYELAWTGSRNINTLVLWRLRNAPIINRSKLLTRYDRLPLVSQALSVLMYIQLVFEWRRSFCRISHLLYSSSFTHVVRKIILPSAPRHSSLHQRPNCTTDPAHSLHLEVLPCLSRL